MGKPTMLRTQNMKLGDPRSRACALSLDGEGGKKPGRPQGQTQISTLTQSTDCANARHSPECLSRTDLLLKLLPSEQLRDMQRVFNCFDADGGGSISASEVGAIFKRLNLVTDRKLLRAIVEHIDVDGDGQIDFGEFCALMTQRSKLTERDDEIEVSEDPNGDNETESAVDDTGHNLDASTHREQRQTFDLAKEQERQEALRHFKHAVASMAFQKTEANSSSSREGSELAKVIKQLWLHPSMRSEWELQRVLHWSERFEFFQQLPPAIESDQRLNVCRVMRAQLVQPGEVFYRQGDSGNCMYFLFVGRVELRRKTEDAHRHPLVTVKQELESFGEAAAVSLSSDEERDATATAVTQCTVGLLSRHDWLRHVRTQAVRLVVDLLQAHPAMAACKRGLLLRMALDFEPIRFCQYVHDILFRPT